MLTEELGIPLRTTSPWKAGLATLAFFAVGAIKCFFVDQKWYRAGLATLIIGAIAAALAFLVGHFLRGLVD